MCCVFNFAASSNKTPTMAEPLGLVASIIAVAGLAEAVIKFAKTTRSIARELKTVRHDLAHSVSRVGFSATITSGAQKALLRYCEEHKASDQSALLDCYERQNVLEHLNMESLLMRAQVRQLRRKMYSLAETRLTLFVTLKWRYSLKGEIDKFHDQMLFVQVHLELMLSSIRLEMELNREQKNEIEMQVIFLSRSHCVHLATWLIDPMSQ